MSEKEIAIEVRDLSKEYMLYNKPSDRLVEALGLSKKSRHTLHEALKDVNLTVYRGESIGIIGKNGSGKSTILKIITGVLSPTRGTVTVNGRISALLELGAGFNMEYTGLENIYLNGAMTGFTDREIDERLESILEFADIGDYVHQPVKTYSSGMFVRLAFALAINIDPEILIVDEALSVGDVFFQAKCYHKFEEFRQQGKTIIFVSHDLSSIAKYCDRVMLLNDGVKLGEGLPKQMIDDYKRVLVGQYELPEPGTRLADDSDIRAAAARASRQNPETLEYGSMKAQITETFVTDENGVRAKAVIKGTRFTIHMKVDITGDIECPIFAFTFKNVRGTEITGTNTMFEKAFLEPVRAGDSLEVTFTQVMSLQGGEYLLSFGCTGYEGETFTVYHRLYDALNVTVVSDKDTVGFYDMDSEISVRKENGKDKKT
ncbi:MAG: ABC transporter ATP-binding protein [Lachnospiraceae bacterium]|nr:ABC transporter ATP-binding protein [Lachnospiraceae bacterium]